MSNSQLGVKLPKPLADGLVLRVAAKDDLAAVAELNDRILLEPHEPPQAFSAWTTDLMSGKHPEADRVKFVIVVDTATGQPVSSVGLLPQTWVYEDVVFQVGRPEMVVTDPAYRRRGLVRAIFEVIHQLSEAEGHLVQGITGVRWLYRRLGYEYALALGGDRTMPLSNIPRLKDGETEPFLTRPALEADLPILRQLYQTYCQNYLVTAQTDEARWRYDLFGHNPKSAQALQVHSILSLSGQIVGYFKIPNYLHGADVAVFNLVLDHSQPWGRVLPSVLRSLKQCGEALLSKAKPKDEGLRGIRFYFGADHPIYDVLDARLGPPMLPYAWYVRVPDVPRFIRHIKPVLEKRLGHSVMAGYSGELKLNFFRSGMRLAFEAGSLVDVCDWPVPETNAADQGATFPPLVFLQLLFGHRSLDELRYSFPDCSAGDEAALLLKALFPKQLSWVLPLG